MDEKLFSSAIEAAIEAGKEILSVYDSSLPVERKEDNSPLTQADKNAHRAIVSRLTSAGLPILSEEGNHAPFENRNQWKKYWLIDPLDGTREFIKHNGEFTVNIALIDGNTPVAGVIYHPVADTLYFTRESGKAFIVENASRHIASNIPAVSMPLNGGSPPSFTVLASRSHPSPQTQMFIDQSRIKYGRVELLASGSSLKLCLLAEGKADVYPRFGPTMEWDTAAGHAILKAVGKNIYSYSTGRELKYNKPDLTNDWFIAK